MLEEFGLGQAFQIAVGAAGRHAHGLGDSDRVIRALIRHDLPESVLPVVAEEDAILAHDAPGRRNVDASRPKLLDVHQQHLDAMRVDAAQVSRDQRVADDLGVRLGGPEAG